MKKLFIISYSLFATILYGQKSDTNYIMKSKYDSLILEYVNSNHLRDSSINECILIVRFDNTLLSQNLWASGNIYGKFDRIFLDNFLDIIKKKLSAVRYRHTYSFPKYGIDMWRKGDIKNSYFFR